MTLNNDIKWAIAQALYPKRLPRLDLFEREHFCLWSEEPEGLNHIENTMTDNGYDLHLTCFRSLWNVTWTKGFRHYSCSGKQSKAEALLLATYEAVQAG